MTLSVAEYVTRFTDEPGYLDFARFGPIGRTARDEDAALAEPARQGAVRVDGGTVRAARPSR